VVYSYGGSFQSKGKYLSNVSVTAADTRAISTFELNANVEIPEVLNHGTKDDPLAGMRIVVKWSIKGKFQKTVQSAEFYVTGDGQLDQL